MITTLLVSNSANLKTTTDYSATFIKIIYNFGGIMTSAFFGGLFAGLWSNYFESKRRIGDIRRDKYYEHRNTVVQIEHEIIPLRVNMSRNLTSIENAIENINNNSVRLILRFYKLKLSTGLSLKLLNLDFINNYSEIYSIIESINSDMQYIDGLVIGIREEFKNGKIDFSRIQMYIQMLSFLLEDCKKADIKILRLESLSKIAIRPDDKHIRDDYIKEGREVKYKITKQEIEKESKKLIEEENIPYKEGESKPKFLALYLDLKRTE